MLFLCRYRCTGTGSTLGTRYTSSHHLFYFILKESKQRGFHHWFHCFHSCQCCCSCCHVDYCVSFCSCFARRQNATVSSRLVQNSPRYIRFLFSDCWHRSIPGKSFRCRHCVLLNVAHWAANFCGPPQCGRIHGCRRPFRSNCRDCNWKKRRRDCG